MSRSSMRLRDGARIAVVGAGPAGLATAKHALESGFKVRVFEAQDDLGGQWHTTSPRSGVWPGMRTNTSRWMTAFSDFPVPPDHELHPFAEQIHLYLRSYADAFGVTPHIEFGRRIRAVRPGWIVDGERFDAVVVASGRFHAPRLPDRMAGFTGEVLHAYDYPGAARFHDKRPLVYGNGVSGHEIASDIAEVNTVISAYRKPRYVLQKVSGGVSSDWQWYTHVGALRRRSLPREEFGRALRDRVVRVAGHPVDYGAPAPTTTSCAPVTPSARTTSVRCGPAASSAAAPLPPRWPGGAAERRRAAPRADGHFTTRANRARRPREPCAARPRPCRRCPGRDRMNRRPAARLSHAPGTIRTCGLCLRMASRPDGAYEASQPISIFREWLVGATQPGHLQPWPA